MARWVRKSHSIKFHVVVVLLFQLVAMLVLGNTLFIFFETQYSAKLLEMNENIVTQMTDNIKSQYMTISDVIDSFAANATLSQFLSSQDSYERFTLFPLYENLLISYKKLNSGLQAIVLRKENGDIFSDASVSSLNVTVTSPAFAALDEGHANVLLTLGSKTYIALGRPIYLPSGVNHRVGDCMFIMNAEALTANAQLSSGSDQRFFVLDDRMQIIATNCGLLPGSSLPDSYVSYLPAAGSASTETQDTLNIAVSKTVPQAGWTVLFVTPRDVVLNELRVIKRTTSLVIGLMLSLVSALYLSQNMRLLRSFRKLSSHIEQIAEGKHTQRLALTDFTEFEHLSETFNDMMDQIELLNAHNLDYHQRLLLQQLENKQSQLLALQSQINPHFLYNTLECINSAGAMCGSEEVVEMSSALASIFRYAIKGDTIVSVRDELDILRCYLSIQHIRFPGMFSVEYRVEDDVLPLQMLKFILQPLVENSISHGFRNSVGGDRAIRVEIKRDGPKLLIAVQDNGTGIDGEALRSLRSRLESSETKTENIGLSNIQRRIRLYYGEEYGMEVDSELGRGFSVKLYLPVS